jgi:hypothetical protein
MKSGSICEDEGNKSFSKQDKIYTSCSITGNITVVMNGLGTTFV